MSTMTVLEDDLTGISTQFLRLIQVSNECATNKNLHKHVLVDVYFLTKQTAYLYESYTERYDRFIITTSRTFCT